MKILRAALRCALSAAVLTLCHGPASGHDWRPYGQALFTDALLADAFGLDVPTYSVAVDADASAAGFFRLCDPYGEGYPYFREIADFRLENASERHIVIDARDENNVIIEQSALGVCYNDEEIFVESYGFIENTGLFTTAFIDSNRLRGSLKEGKITFTTPNCFILSTPRRFESSEFIIPNNLKGEFCIELLPEAPAEDKESDSLTGLVADSDVSEEIYNLQGLPVAEPSRGQILIKIVRTRDTIKRQVIRLK